jgi:hypothetical protein
MEMSSNNNCIGGVMVSVFASVAVDRGFVASPKVNCFLETITGVREWFLFYANFSTISWWKQVNFQWDDDEARLVLDQHALLDFIYCIEMFMICPALYIVNFLNGVIINLQGLQFNILWKKRLFDGV